MFDWFHNRVPYTDYQQKNLDWLTETVREGEAAVEAKIEEADTAIANAEAATEAANTAKTGADTAAGSANAAATAANNAKDAANTAAANAQAAADKWATPYATTTVAGMTDHAKIYVYTGTEVGYTAGNWYYWNGTAWTSGGVYVGDISDAVLFSTSQSKTDAEKAQARENCGAVSTEEVEKITNKLVLKYSANKWKESDVTAGYVATNGNRSSTGTYQTLTDPIPVAEGDIVRFYGNNFTTVNARFICAYDSDNQPISASGSSSDTRTYTVPAGISSIIPSLLASITNVMVTINEEVSAYEPYHTPYYVATKAFIPFDVRTEIHIEAGDNEATVIQKMVTAYTTGNCDVVFDRAVYNFGTAIKTVVDDYDLTVNEIPIGNNCHYYFNGASLVCNIDLTGEDPDFYCNLLGCQRSATDFELHDGILSATDTRYVVHDEGNQADGTYKHLYQNMVMTYNTNDSTDIYRKCIGGGTGKNGCVEIIGCVFTSDGSDSCVSYHGNATDYPGSKFDLAVRDCWFSNSFRAGQLSTSQTGTLIFCNNSSGSALQTYSGWSVTQFLNEQRP